MRASFYQRRRVPGMRVVMRAEGDPNVVPPGGDPAEESSDDDSSDDELSDGESSDDDSDDESESPTPGPTKSKPPISTTTLGSGATTTPSTPPELGTTTTPLPNPSTIIAAPVTTPSASITVTTTTTSSQPAQETEPHSSSPPVLPSTSTPPPQSSTLVSSSAALPSATTSPLPVLNPGDITTPTVQLPQSTGSPTDVPQSDNAINQPSKTDGGGSGNSQRAGQIAGGVIGSIAFIALLLLAAWFWRRRRNQNRLSRRLSGLGADDDSPYRGPAPHGPGSFRSPSSIMNQLMTAAYAAEDGRMSYRDSRDQIYDNYADEKQQGFGGAGLGMHANESTERLTPPAAAQLRPPSIAARTETTNRTESTWKTWGVLAGTSRVSAPRNWWVDRYFRTT